MPEITDQIGRIIQIPEQPLRIVSLVPSQTELLADLGLHEEVIGITKFCVQPDDWFRTKTRIGGTKNVDIAKVLALKPNLVIANKEENVKDQVEELDLRLPVYISDVDDLPAALQMIGHIGALTHRMEEASQLIARISDAFQQISPKKKLRTAYFIWKDPWMSVGGDTYISQMMDVCGFENILADRRRYPVVSIDEIAQMDCEQVLLSSEPYPFKEKHIAELRKVMPNARIRLVDGEMFSWYGSRLLQAAPYFQDQIRIAAEDQ